MFILAIDPGPIESAYVTWDGKRVGIKGKQDNAAVLSLVQHCYHDRLVVEMVACYGMAVGKDVFETAYWIGRFCQAAKKPYDRVYRKDVKMHLCHSMRAKDSNITKALVDRFTPMAKNHGKGTKKAPGFFYGFKRDIWQAFALAVTWWDKGGVECKRDYTTG